jgi:regulator of replication initiation timing
MQQLAGDPQRHQTHDQLDQIEKNNDTLSSTVRDRNDQLKGALELPVQWSESLQSWLETAEKRIKKVDVIPTEEHKLKGLINYKRLAEDLESNHDRIMAVVEEGYKLCKHFTGDEAVALQARLDSLRLYEFDMQTCPIQSIESWS